MLPFVPRAALAYGQIIHGADIPDDASPDLAEHKEYRNRLLLGFTMVQAHLGERVAPPFGLYVDPSARSDAPDGQSPIHHAWWPWFKKEQTALVDSLKDRLDAYYTWCEERSGPIEYAPERIKAHREMAKQYFCYGKTLA